MPPKLPKRVFIWDETFREGLRAPTVFLTYVEQVKLAKLMDDAGMSIINVGFPALSEGDKHNVKRIVNEHVGIINVQSKLGEGTLFCIYLPLK